MSLSNEIIGVINVPFHGESAYEIAVRQGFIGTEEEWLESIGELNEEKITEILENMAERAHGYTWYVNTDKVIDKTGKSYGKMSDCMKADFVGTWFYAVTTSSEAGSTAYPSKYTIDGANGYINLRDYVVWTGQRLVRVNTYEAKSSTQKNSDGKYSPKSGVDGLMSSTDKAYLTDLINEYWDKNKLPVHPNPDPIEGWMCNWCRDNGIYLGGLKKDCGGHPPVLNDNHTSWALMVFNGMATDADSLNRNHRLQIAFDLVNSKIYMRRGWISSNEWADWSEVGKIADGAVDFNQLSERVINRIIAAENKTDVVFVEERGATISLDENVKEIVVTSSNANFNLLLPKNMWKYWRCIINLTAAEQVENMDVGFYDGNMFGSDVSWQKPSGGKTYLLVRENTNRYPSDFNLYEIDNVTREIVA